MPPKAKVTKETIVNAAVEIIRQQGEGAFNARSIAAKLGCSTQPVFSNFASMSELRRATLERVRAIYDENTARIMSLDKYPPYKASGMAYIDFARREKELFKLMFMRERSTEFENGADDLDGLFSFGVGLASTCSGVESEKIELFHFEVWSFIHGIASMLATGFLDMDENAISAMVTDVYLGLKSRFGVN